MAIVAAGRVRGAGRGGAPAGELQRERTAPRSPALVHLRSFLLAGQWWQERGPRLTTGLAVPLRPEAAAFGASVSGRHQWWTSLHLEVPAQPVGGRSFPGACPASGGRGPHLPWPICLPSPGSGSWVQHQGSADPAHPSAGQASCLPAWGASAGDRPLPLTVPFPLLPPWSHTQPWRPGEIQVGRRTLQRRAGCWRLLGRPLQEPLQPHWGGRLPHLFQEGPHHCSGNTTPLSLSVPHPQAWALPL